MTKPRVLYKEKTITRERASYDQMKEHYFKPSTIIDPEKEVLLHWSEEHRRWVEGSDAMKSDYSFCPYLVD